MSTNSTKAAGFTLVEILIIAPIVIIAISGFIALMITMVGDVMATRDRNAMTYEIRDSLDRIEQDTRLSVQFLTTTVNIQAPQGSNDGTTPFSNTNSLILGSLTTDKNPIDTTRQLVFYAKQPNDCGALQVYNRPLIGKVIYFIKNGSLWRRVALPPYNTNNPVNDETVCMAPWQQNSCTPGLVNSRCQTGDVELMRNVDSFSVKYYSSPQSAVDIGAASALSAGSIEVTLTGKKSIAGRSVTHSGSVRVTKLNNIDADLPIPAVPSVIAQSSNANGATFSWQAVPNATSYVASYNINGGAWTNATLDSTTLNYTVSSNRQDTVTFKIAAKNTSGTSAEAVMAFTIPDWNSCGLQNGWANFAAGSWSSSGFTKTPADVVQLKGIIKDGSVAPGTVICVLPVGFRPTGILPFQIASSSPTNTSRVDVYPSGEVTVGDSNGSTGFMSLDNIRFIASVATYPTATLTLQNSWETFNVGGFWPPLTARKDSYNRVFIQGTIKNGSMTTDMPFALLPAGYVPDAYYHMPVRSNAPFNSMGVSASPANLQYKNTSGAGINAFYAPSGMYYASGGATWTTINSPYSNGWVAFGGGFPVIQYTKSLDGMVTLRGMIKSGSNAADTLITALPTGYRPKERMVFHISATGLAGRIDIQPNGEVLANGVNNIWVDLSPISFMAEQ